MEQISNEITDGVFISRPVFCACFKALRCIQRSRLVRVFMKIFIMMKFEFHNLDKYLGVEAGTPKWHACFWVLSIGYAEIFRSDRFDSAGVARRALPLAHCLRAVICSLINLLRGTNSVSCIDIVMSFGSSRRLKAS